MRKTLWLIGIAVTAMIAQAMIAQANLASAAGKSCAELSQPPTDLEIVDNPISKAAPRYPQQAIQKRLEGFVKFVVTISPQGDVTDVKVTDAKPAGMFEQSAVDAVRTWKFCASGRTLTLTLSVNFQLPPEMRNQQP